MTRKKFVALWPFLFGAFAAAVMMWSAHLVSPTHWLDVRSVRVFDARVGHPVAMAVDRTIVRDFRGQWLVTIRRQGFGGWETWCNASGSANYSTEAQFPDPLTLQWWTYPDCHPLPAGRYVMRTAWTVMGLGPLPDKEVRVDSNIFEVAP